MYNKQPFPNVMFGASTRPQSAALAILLRFLFFLCVLMLINLTAQPALGQTFRVIHSFTGGDGSGPSAGLIMDQAGNLYGTAAGGGPSATTSCGWGGCGTVFRLAKQGTGWVFSSLYAFKGKPDGKYPSAVLVFGPDDGLYGTTSWGGASNCFPDGCGTVFKLAPDGHGGWAESTLYRFTGGDGLDPGFSPVTFDTAGAIYLTTTLGGEEGRGNVVKLSPSHDGWTSAVLHSFTGGLDGGGPDSGVIFDETGNLYGVTAVGGSHFCSAMNNLCGIVFELTLSGGEWTENVLYNFEGRGDGSAPVGRLVFDRAGKLYGTTKGDGHSDTPGGGGSVFMLTPSNDRWTFTALHSFSSLNIFDAGPWAGLVMDSVGNVYGTTFFDGANGCGSVFRLTRSFSCWTYTSLHDFTCGSDGGLPLGGLLLGVDGSLYGTASTGGAYGKGVVFEITP
jgi:uncharacterized repeat protein (TIGR03803 family)